MTEDEWVERYVMELGQLGTRASHDELAELGRGLWATLGQVDPEAAARGEFDLCPPQDD